jgi:hypothetical protein
MSADLQREIFDYSQKLIHQYVYYLIWITITMRIPPLINISAISVKNTAEIKLFLTEATANVILGCFLFGVIEN